MTNDNRGLPWEGDVQTYRATVTRTAEQVVFHMLSGRKLAEHNESKSGRCVYCQKGEDDARD